MITNHLTMVTIVPLIIGKLFTEVEPNICACCCGNRGWSRRLNRSHRCCCCFCCCCWCCSCCSNNSGWIYAFTCLDKKQIYVRKNNNRITINKRTNHQSVWYFLFTKKTFQTKMILMDTWVQHGLCWSWFVMWQWAAWSGLMMVIAIIFIFKVWSLKHENKKEKRWRSRERNKVICEYSIIREGCKTTFAK